MIKSQILKKLFLVISAYFLVFGLITGFVSIISIPSESDASLIVTQILLHVNFTTFVGMIVAIILCTVCWFVFPPPRNTVLLRFVFGYVILVAVMVSMSTDMLVYSPNTHNFLYLFTATFLISSQLIFNTYLKLASNLKIKRKNEDI